MSRESKMDANAVLRQVHKDYAALARLDPAHWPALDLVAVAREVAQPLPADKSGFDNVLAALNADSGWARFRSEVHWTGNPDTPDYDQWGAPLFAEWVENETSSVRLRLDPDEPTRLVKWLYTETVVTDEEAEDAEGLVFLREQVAVLGHKRRLPGMMLIYHVFWGGDGKGAVRRVFDRFAGFQGEEVQ